MQDAQLAEQQPGHIDGPLRCMRRTLELSTRAATSGTALPTEPSHPIR
jgi:hypothetical protein